LKYFSASQPYFCTAFMPPGLNIVPTKIYIICSILAGKLTDSLLSQERYDNLDLTGNLSQWVQYGELTQEEKKLTLEYLTTDTG